MSDADAQAIRAELAELKALVREGITPRPVIDTAGAMELVGVGSRTSLERWCKRWKVRACGQGRYARRAVLAGLEREATSGERKRRQKKEEA